MDQKTVICEIVEAIEYDELKTFSAWENKTQEVIALQNKWKTIGFAPQKMNVKIFERFRHACDDFFKKKGEFFKSLKEGMNENLEKKKASAQNDLAGAGYNAAEHGRNCGYPCETEDIHKCADADAGACFSGAGGRCRKRNGAILQENFCLQ